jgi:hypothetical protein
MKSFEYPVIGGITGHVFGTGESMVVNDVVAGKTLSLHKGLAGRF